MKLGLVTGYTGTGVPMDLIHAAEDAGFDSVWTAEAYGSDAIVPLTWIAAQTKKIKLGTGIMQMPARTPAMTAMTARTITSVRLEPPLDKLSEVTVPPWQLAACDKRGARRYQR